MTITSQVFRWKPAAWLKVTGTDAFAFLQGQFTNDLRELDKSSAVYGLWLSQKGKVLADSFILKGQVPEAFWVGSYFSAAAVIRERLESYIIADDVIIEDETAHWQGMTLVGPASSSEELVRGKGFFFPGRRGLAEHQEWVTPGLVEILGAQMLGETDMLRARIHAGIPAIPMDIGHGELPNEGGLEVGGISYTKGCYLGQEVMARLKNLGQVRRRLVRVKGEMPPPAAGSVFYQGGKKVGELRSVVAESAGFSGLALLTILQLQRGPRLSLAPEGPGLVDWSETA